MGLQLFPIANFHPTLIEEPELAIFAPSDTETRQQPAISGALDLSISGRGAGYKFFDPTFGTEILRVTDGLTLDDPAFTGNKPSLNLSSAAEHPIWNADGTRFWVGAQFGGCYPFSFNRAAFTATRLNETTNTPSDGTYMRIPASAAEPAFSRTDPDILWFIDGRAGSDSHTIVKYNFDDDTISVFYDLDSLGFPLTSSTPNKTGTGVGYISLSQAPNERVCVEFGGRVQEEHYLIAVFDVSNPATRWVLDTRNLKVGTGSGDMAEFTNTSMNLAIRGTVSITAGGNTVTGNASARFTEDVPVGSDIIVNGERKTVTGVSANDAMTISGTWSSTGSGLTCKTLGFGLHNAVIDKSGNYVLLYRGMPYTSGVSIVYVWEVGTSNVTHITYKYGGHAEPGYGEWLNVIDEGPTNAPFWFFRRPLSDPNNSALVTRLNNYSPPAYGVGDHSSWNSQSYANQDTPVIDSTYLMDYGRAWQCYDNEILAVRTDQTPPNNAVHRLAHTYSDIRGDAGAPTQFDYSPRANVDPFGEFALYCSNHGKTLGSRFNGSGNGLYRVDIFIVRIKSEEPDVPAVSSVSHGTPGDTTATITFDTDVLGDAVVEYSTDLSYGSSAKSYPLKTSGHSVVLSGLAAGTVYNYRVKSRNRAGVAGEYVTGSFTTTGSAPSDFLSDTFTEASNTALTSHVGETGATWSLGSGQSANATIDAASDRLYFTGSTNYYSSGTPASADYYVEGLFYVASNNVATQVLGITGRHQTGANSHYGIRWNVDLHLWQLFKRVAGTFTALATYDPGGALTNGATHTVRLTMTGSTIKMHIDGVERASVTDTAISTAGRAGVAGGGAASSATTGIHLTSITAR